MKSKFLIITALFSMLFGVQAQTVSVSDATTVAENFFSGNSSRGNRQKSASQVTLYQIKKSVKPQKSTQGVVYYYIFNNGNNGYVVVGGDKRMLPVLAYSNKNAFDTTDMPANVKYWFDLYQRELDSAIQKGVSSNEVLWQAYTSGPPTKDYAVDSMLTTKWGQSAPYNDKCPLVGTKRSVTGCGATAMSQIMKFWAYPKTGVGTHSYTPKTNTSIGTLTVNFGNTTYDWSNMIDKPTSNSTTAQKNAVSTIMYHCGVALQMDYGPNGSAAYSLLYPINIAQGDRDIPYVLKKHFRYSSAFGRFKSSPISSYSDAIWKTLIKEELDKGRPILYSGSDASGGGHGFICDGYDNNDKFHFNFGWDGLYDGYYALTAINPDSYNFASSQNAIFAFVPDSLNTEPNPADLRLCSNKMTISSTTVMPNGSLTIAGTFMNYGYDTLNNGQLGLAIYDHAGNLVTRQAGNFTTMIPYAGGNPQFTIQLNGVAQGAYYAKLCYKLNGDNNWYFMGDDANQTEMLRNRVDFDVLSDKYITLNVKKDSSISINLSANTPTATSILVRSGDSTYTITADTAMTGIKTFKAGANTMTIYGDVNRFDCKENYTKITGIDASKNTGLTFLYCSYNDLTSLDLSKNVALCTLYCSYTKIKSLNVNGCTALTYIQCMYDSLSTLDLSTNTALTKLFCTYNKLTSLNVRNNTALCTLSCNDNKLTSLDVSNNVALCSLSCGYNKLTSLDVSKNIALIYLSCTRNDSLKTLNVSKNTALKILTCSNNGLSSLDVSKNMALTSLNCGSNALTSLDVSKNTALTSLSCSFNKLTSLDVSNNTALTSLFCYSNQLTSLDVSNNAVLTLLECCGNPFTTTAYDSIMCSLPIRNSGNNARFYPLFGSSDANATKFAASNSLNAKAKNWNVLYFDNLEIPATSGNFDCSTLIPQVNMNRYITLKCTKDSLISINLSANNANTPIKIVSGDSVYNITAGTTMIGLQNYNANATTMTIYGDVTKFNCAKNYSKVIGLDVSKNTALTYLECSENVLTSLDISKNTALCTLYCYKNSFTTEIYDTLMCSLPSRNSGDNAIFYPLLDYINASAFMKSNSENAKNKNWEIRYARNENIVPATSGYYDCIKGYPQPNMSRYINLYVQKGEKIGINLSADSADTPVKIVSGDSVYYIMAGPNELSSTLEYYFADTTSMIVYGDVTKFSCVGSAIIGFNVNHNKSLTELRIEATSLSTLDVLSECDSLKILFCPNNGITKLDVRDCPNLISLDCSYNNLTSLNLWANTKLTTLRCNANKLTELDVNDNTALTYLSCSFNNLTSLDVSKNTALRELNCLNNSLTSLNISKCTSLTRLFCHANLFTTADYDSLMCSLPSRNSGDNARFYPLENVNDTNSAIFLATNASNATAKNWQVVYWNNDKSISTSGNYDCVTGYPPQANMSCYITLNVAKDTLIKINLSADNANTPIKIVSGTWDTTIIAGTSLTGNIYYPSYDTIMTIYGDVKEFDCKDNRINITGLDVSHNTALTHLECGYNNLTSLDVSKNIALCTLNCYNNKLTSLDVNKNTALTHLECGYNNLTSLDVSKNTALTYLECTSNNLTSLDVSKNTALTHLECGYNKLTSLDVSACTVLNYLRCYGNKFTTAGYDSLMCSLPSKSVSDNAKFYPLYNANDDNSAIFLATNASNAIAKNWEVRYLYANQGSFPATSGNYDCVTGYPPQVNMNRYITLNVKQGEQINISLSADTNTTPIKIASGAWDTTIIANAWEYYNFYVAANTLTIYGNVSKFNCSNNDSNIIGLDASHNTALTELYCKNNNLTTLNISSCTALTLLYCEFNNLTSLDVSTCTSLGYLHCENNNLTTLDVSGCTSLEELHCYNNNLTTLDVSACTSLKRLSCDINSLTTLNVSSCTALKSLHCTNNRLSILDVSGCTSLGYLHCENNSLTTLDVSKCITLKELRCYNNSFNTNGYDSLMCSLPINNSGNIAHFVPLNNSSDATASAFMASNATNATAKNWKVIYYSGGGDIPATSGTYTCSGGGGTTPQVNMNRYITLKVKQGEQIRIALYTDNDNTPIKIASGAWDTTIMAYSSSAYYLYYYTAADTMVIYGDVKEFDCDGNDSNIIGLDVSHNTALTHLECYDNQLTSLDVSACTSLAYLYCSNNNLTSLDVTGCTSLYGLNCSNNNLDTLDVSGCTSLVELYCYENNLTTLDVSACTNLEWLVCYNNNLTSLDVSTCTSLGNLTCHNNQLTSLNINDCSLLYALSCYGNKFSTNGYDSLMCLFTDYSGTGTDNTFYPLYDANDTNSATFLAANATNATAKNWKVLYYDNYNPITTNGTNTCTFGGERLIDTTNYITLIGKQNSSVSIYCDGNNSRTFVKIVSGQWDTVALCDNIPELYFYDSIITIYGAISNFNIYIDTSIIAIDASNHTSLEHLYFRNTRAINSLNVNGCTSLEELYCAHNSLLTSLDVSGCTSLETLRCNNNNLTSLDVSTCTSLYALYCDSNNLTSLDVSSCTSLEELGCSSNNLTSLNVSACTALNYLKCHSNSFTTATYDSIMCSLPIRNSRDKAKFFPLYVANNNDNYIFMASNSNNAIAKNWNILYAYAYQETIPATSGTYTCSGGGTNPEDTTLIVNTSRYITLNVKQGEQINIFLTADTNNTPIKIVSGAWDTTIMAYSSSAYHLYYYAAANTMVIYGDVKMFDCDGNDSNIIGLDVSHNTALTHLECYDNQLTSLDVSACTNLEWLVCYNNKLTTLDVSGCTSLEKLYCSNNNLTSLNVIGCTSLVELYCYENNLTTLDISGCTGLEELFGSNNNLTALYVSGCTSLTYLDCYNNKLTSLDVSKNTALTSLDCQNNQLTNLNVSKNTALKSLYCNGNQLTSLDVSKNTALTYLNCENNLLDTLDISKNIALCTLACDNNSLTTLNVSSCTALKSLHCTNNSLSTLDVSDCASLKSLYCYGNKFSTAGYDSLMCSFIDYSGTMENNYFYPLYDANDTNSATFLAANATNATAKNWQAEYYDNYNPITTNGNYTCTFGGEKPIDTTQYITLIGKQNSSVSIYCDGNNSRTFVKIVSGQWDTVVLCDDISQLYFYDSVITIYGAISEFSMYGNTSVTAIDASNHTALTYLSCSHNQIASLDVSGCTSLYELSCSSNNLTSLNVSSCTALTLLYCEFNNLTSLNVSSCTALTLLSCEFNNLTSLDVSSCTSLEYLYCDSNNLTSLDVSSCTSLEELGCSSNNLTSLNVSACTALNYLKCNSNPFTTATYDSIMCSLPSRSVSDDAEFYPLYNANDANSAIFLAANATNATAKNWQVLYDDNGNSITTNGTYTCSGGGTNPEDTTLIVNTSRYITLNVKQGEQINIALSADTNNTPIKIVSGAWDTTIIANAWEYYNFYVAANTLTIYGNVSKFNCSNNDSNIIGLDASHNTALTELYCKNNNLTLLNVIGCTSLEELHCGSNNLTSLNISSCTALKSLHCTNNSLSILDVSDCTSLEYLSCYNNNLTTLDVSACTSLEYLSCDNNSLTTLNVSSCRALSSLHCSNNSLSILDVSGCTSLGYLYCKNNSLTTLDVSKCITLKELRCYENSFSTNGYDSLMCSLPINNSGNIVYFVPLNNSSDATASAFMASNATNATAKNWKVIYYSGGGDIPATSGTYTCSGGGGTTPEDTTLIVNTSRYITLNVKQGEQITINLTTDSANIPVRVVSGDSISDFTTKTATWMRDTKFYATSNTMVIYGDVKYFSCKNNTINIVGIDISNNTQLSSLDCSNNNLTRLDISKNTSLTLLYCNNNNLTLLDASKNTSLTTLSCFNNKFTTAGYDSLMCLLPTLGKTGEFIPLESDTSANVTIFMASNSNNAKDKKWNVFYVDYTNIPATTGTYTCSNIPDDPTSISEVSLSNIELYPNPAKTMLTIENATENVQIFDVAGRKIMQVENKGEALLQINIANLAKGMYFVKVGNYTTKFVKE